MMRNKGRLAKESAVPENREDNPLIQVEQVDLTNRILLIWGIETGNI